MVPVTEATIEWETPDGRRIARWGTVVVNRLLTDWIAPATRDVRPPDLYLVPEVDGSGLAKDFTTPLVRESRPPGRLASAERHDHEDASVDDTSNDGAAHRSANGGCGPDQKAPATLPGASFVRGTMVGVPRFERGTS